LTRATGVLRTDLRPYAIVPRRTLLRMINVSD